MTAGQDKDCPSLENTPVLILCGGLGKRLGAFAKDIPKSLVDIGGEPFLAHQLRLLKREGAKEIYLLTGYLGDKIKEYLKDGHDFDLKANYVEDGEKPLGTGGAVATACKKIKGAAAVMYGDSYLDIPMARVLKHFKESDALALMTILENHSNFNGQASNVEFNEQSGKIVAYNKKKPNHNMHYIDFGLSFFLPAAFENQKKKAPFDLSVIFETLAKQGQLLGYVVQRRFYDINTPESLIETRAYLSQNNLWQVDRADKDGEGS